MRIAESTGDPAWLYHELSLLDTGFYGGRTRYPAPPGEYYKELGGGLLLPPPPEFSGVDTLKALKSRRSRRRYGPVLNLESLSAVLYYSVGVTGVAWWGGPRRAYPSAGALMPVEAYVVARGVSGLDPGIYHYNPGEHSLEPVRLGDYSRALYEISLEQEHVSTAPATIILTSIISRTASKYGWRSYRYIHLDTGHAGENIYLASEALGLGTVAVGAFYDRRLCALLDIDCVSEMPMIMYPVGPRTG
ncbi:MAG: SagB/ThcOx family dehydrogenase [Desulfurococcales archaeon]|nr:SagB/ThcOx family dehydrogenase [Desulfurococcales archaeon]